MLLVRSTIVVFLLFLQLTAMRASSIVTIWAHTGKGASVGTGFFTSKDGQILTCFHVIDGASWIEIFSDQVDHSTDIIIEAVAPDKDLAFLRIRNLKSSVKFLTLDESIPDSILDEELFMYGHAAGIKDQRFVARLTRKPFVLSQEIHDPTTSDRLMSADDVKLLTLQSDGFKGISGGPLVSGEDHVLGVVSGSLTIGGGIVWAIPAQYARVGEMDVINKPVTEVKSWKGLSKRPFLLTGTATKLRLLLPVSSGLTQSLDDYFRSVDELDNRVADFPALALQLKRDTHMMNLMVDNIPPDMLDRDVGTFDNPALQHMFETSVGDLTKVGSAMQEWDTTVMRLTQRMAQLGEEYDAFFSALPKTDHNRELEERCDRDIQAVADDLQKSLQEAGAAEIDKQIESSLSDFAALAFNVKKVRDIAKLAERLDSLSASLTSPEIITTLSVVVTYFRRAGRVVEALSYSEVGS
jgi:hypothetical protein